jgi:PKD repeat protein
MIKVGQSHTYVHESITFIAGADAGDFNITGYQFSFSDGRITGWLTQNTTTHVFSNLSFEHVSFRIRTDSGFVSNWSEPLWLQIIERLPFAGFEIIPTVGDIFTTYKFEVSEELKAIDSIIASYRWEFGDGGNSAENATDHAYTDDGSYNVSLTITYSTDGGTSGFWKTLRVANLAPEAGFFASGKTISLGDIVTFNASTTTDRDDLLSELAFEWQFGDDSTSSGIMTSHEYTEANTYLVILTVTDDDNETSRFTLEITVRDTVTDNNGSSAAGDGPDLALALAIIGVLAVILIIVLIFMMKTARPREDDELLEE